MTAKINKSTIDAFPAQFDLVVAEHAGLLRHWREHMARVEAQKDKDVAPIDRFQPFERPRASDLVESAINEKFEADYEVIDDSATVIELKKRELIGRVQQLEGEAILAIVPAGKQRLMAMREEQIREADSALGAELLAGAKKPGLIKRLLGDTETVDISASIEEIRPAADTEFLAELKEVRRRVRAINFIAAQAMHDIEDLTVDTVGQWKEPDFSGV